MKDKKTSKNKKSTEFWRGYRKALDDTSWDCGDCGNRYEATVTRCPNNLIHQANNNWFSQGDDE